jgi:2,3-diketo-5-methylthiopentyl-1-phosphate enolase
MVNNILFPDSHELRALSLRVGGLVSARYSFPATDLAGASKMAVQIAAGQTLGFVPDDLATYIDYVGRVEAVEMAGTRGMTTIAFPRTLFGEDMAGLLTILFGKTSFAPGLRIESVSGDEQYLSRLSGPKFGLEGIRKLAGRKDKDESGQLKSGRRPLLMAILKPGVGPSDEPLALQFGKLVGAGTDLVKDDETRVDLTIDDALNRLKKVIDAGRGRGIYVMHLSGPAFELRDRALTLQRAGAQAFLFCPYTYGISLLQSLCGDPEITVPIFAHPAFTGVMGHGSSSIANEIILGTLMRWAGCDGVLFPSPYGSIALPKAEAQAIHRALCRPEGSLKMSASVPSAGIMPEFVEKIHGDFGVDVVVNAGTGMARTGGSIEDGAKAFLKEINAHYL